MEKGRSNTNTTYLDRIHEPNIPIHRQANDADRYLGSCSKGSKRTPDRSETIPMVNRRPVVHRKDVKARNLPSCQPTRKKSTEPSERNMRTALQVLEYLKSTPSEGITIKKPTKGKLSVEIFADASYGGARSQTRGTDDIWRTTSGMVQQEAGYSSPVDNGSGVYSGLQRMRHGDNNSYKNSTSAPKYQS